LAPAATLVGAEAATEADDVRAAEALALLAALLAVALAALGTLVAVALAALVAVALAELAALLGADAATEEPIADAVVCPVAAPQPAARRPAPATTTMLPRSSRRLSLLPATFPIPSFS